jgi:hypothetical protein
MLNIQAQFYKHTISGRGGLLLFKLSKFMQRFGKFVWLVCAYEQSLVVLKFKLQSFVARNVECRSFAEYSKPQAPAAIFKQWRIWPDV